MKKYILLFISLSITTTIYSQSSTARFLFLQPSSEVTSLGGAGVSIPNNSFAAYYNPASFALVNTFEMAASFERPFSSFYNDTHSMITFVNPFEEFGSVALTFNLFWLDPQIRNSYGYTYDKPKLFSPTHSQIKLSYATFIYPNLSFGTSFSLLNINHTEIPTAQEQGDGIVSTVLFDLGLLYNNLFPNLTYSTQSKLSNKLIDESSPKGLSIGVSLINLGPNIYFVDKPQADNPPSFLLLGISYWPISTDLISSRVLFDLENRFYDSNSFDFLHIGNEILLYKILAMRYGYVININDSDASFFTIGFGAKLKLFSINVARYEKYITPTWNFDVKINWEF